MKSPMEIKNISFLWAPTKSHQLQGQVSQWSWNCFFSVSAVPSNRSAYRKAKSHCPQGNSFRLTRFRWRFSQIPPQAKTLLWHFCYLLVQELGGFPFWPTKILQISLSQLVTWTTESHLFVLSPSLPWVSCLYYTYVWSALIAHP